MARISLRAYQRDIEELVETHQFDQAIAHCRHILRFYTKEVNTYRLLGKAYLESQRYGDASDIFIRVLSTIPDDFVSHVGMSIIREDEGNLDDAIWHMQRAFETQPANSAIQGELRRLHGRREGIEPPKIRLTRGALARMYLKGELFAQALAELRAGLHEDPKRYDLQVVLAQAYYLAGQRVDAAEACSTLLKSLPFCLEANKILGDILSHSERADEAQVYIKRVQSLDPYMAHLSPAAYAPEKVTDSAVLLERLEWRPGLQTADAIQQPEWATSLGVDLGTDTGPESLPDWLGMSETKGMQGEIETTKPLEEAPPLSNEQTPVVNDAVPDWMKEAGWTESQAAGDLDGFLPLSDTEGIVGDLEPAEIPEWLKTLAPSVNADAPPLGAPSEPFSISPEEPAQAVVLPWLEETPPGPTDSVAMWLEKQEPPTAIEEQLDLGSTNFENIPDWLQDLGEPIATEKTIGAASLEITESEELVSTGGIEDDRLNIGTAAALTAAAGLIGAAQQPEETQEVGPTGLVEEFQSEAVMSAEISDWLQDLGSVDVEPAVEPGLAETPTESTVPSLEEPLAEAQIPEWLQNMDSQPDDWVTEIGEADATQRALLDDSKSTTTVESQSIEDDEAFAWLENLAARQGAEEALLLSPDERRDTPPDWILSEAKEEIIPEVEELTPAVKEDITPGIVGVAILATAALNGAVENQDAIATDEHTGVGPSVQEEPGIELEAAAVPDLMLTTEADGATEDRDAITTDELTTISPSIQEEPGIEQETTVVPELMLPTEADGAGTEPAGSTLEEVAEISATSVVLRGIEHAAEDEMLFYPLETAEASEELLILDEGPIPIVEGDTKPTAVQAGTVQTIGAIAVATGVIGTIAETDQDSTPAPSDVVEEQSTHTPELVEEQPQFVELSGTGEEILEPSSEIEKPIAEGVVIPEEDEAFAWLESLAVRQGAEEALLLTPDERQESPPEWVMQEVAEEEEKKSDDSLGDTELPEWLQETPLEAQETEPALETETSVPDWLRQPAGIAEETAGREELPPLAPELPTWLAGIEDTHKDTEATIWSPSDESFDVIEPEAVQDIPEVVPETVLEPALDLNKAGLVDLERLPGIGFTKAQAILDYREKHGPYQEVDELLLVTGITADMIFELKQHLSVGGMEVTAAVEPPAQDHQILLVQARNALVQGDIPLAISRYGILIDKNQMLPDVITDLNEALYRFPIDVSIWEALGDTHMHAGHLQDALNAYTKAEEYLH